MYAIKNPADYNADYILANGNKTYICRLNPSMVNRQSNVPIEEQPVWQITCIEKKEVDGKTIMTAKYPDGKSTLYYFKASECELLNYDYQK